MNPRLDFPSRSWIGSLKARASRARASELQPNVQRSVIESKPTTTAKPLHRTHSCTTLPAIALRRPHAAHFAHFQHDHADSRKSSVRQRLHRCASRPSFTPAPISSTRPPATTCHSLNKDRRRHRDCSSPSHHTHEKLPPLSTCTLRPQ